MMKKNAVQKKKGRIQVKIIIQKFVNSLKKIRDFFTKSILPYIFTILCIILLIVVDIFILSYPQSITINDFTSIFNLLISISFSVFALSLTIYTLILDRTQRPISHLYGLLYRINFFYLKRIFPVFCFEGKILELKRVITKNQLKDFLFTQKWYEEAIQNNNKDLARQIALSREYMWQNIIKESKQLLGAIRVPYIESPASAESQCAYLVKKRFVNYSNSQDLDSLLFGCPHVIQNLSKSLRRKIQGKWQYQKIHPVKIDLQKNLKSFLKNSVKKRK